MNMLGAPKYTVNTIAEEAVATEAQEEAPAEAGLVDIAASSVPQP
jgi:hypothetical protein